MNQIFPHMKELQRRHARLRSYVQKLYTDCPRGTDIEGSVLSMSFQMQLPDYDKV